MNQLKNETSPYLLQHAHNPVDWYAWKPEAFERARLEDKPILVSIGYSTCHWCHVMERESFENEEVAELMNEHFINIKVDREERPDVDQIYMETCQIINKSGGWPLNCFLLPDGRPYFAGTYFPPLSQHGRPSWVEVLQRMSNAYINQRQTVEEQADRLTKIVAGSGTRLLNNELDLTQEQVFTPVLLNQIYYSLHESFDYENGGFGGAPKFPGTMALDFLMHYYQLHKKEETVEHLIRSYLGMIRGGIYDQIGGGFSRYTVDSAWLVPHFEKMLYDNALIVSGLSDLLRSIASSNPLQTNVVQELTTAIEETLTFIAREMTAPEGGFYAALDADSEGEEGKFYVWQKAEIDEILGKDSPVFCEAYGVDEEGNWEGKVILNRLHGVTGEEHRNLEASRAKLLKNRDLRIRPGLDDKILLNWNALMITAYAKAYQALGKEEYQSIAVAQLEFVLTNFKQEGTQKLFHTYKDGKAQYDAFLDDYAFLIEALIEVHNCTFETKYLQLAKEYAAFVIKHFFDKKEGLFYFTSAEQTDIVVRRKELFDNALPNGNSTMVRNLQRLGLLFDQSDWREMAREILFKVRDAVQKFPSAFGRWGTAYFWEVQGAKEIAIVGANALEKAQELNKKYLPNKVIMAASQQNPDFPLLKGKLAAKNALIYVCEDYVCQAPVEAIEDLELN